MKDSTFEKYCLVVDEWFVNGFNGRKAYQKFYPDTSEESAEQCFSKISSIVKVKEYKDSKTKKTSSELQITLLSQLQRLNDIADHPETKPSDMVNCIKEQNKLLALYRDHNEQKTTKINLSRFTDEQIEQKLKEIANDTDKF